MTKVLLSYGTAAIAGVLGLTFLLALIGSGETLATGVAIGGLLAAASFLGLVWGGSKLLEAGPRKAVLVLVLFGKLGVIGLCLYVALVKLQTDPIGMAIGIGASILGLTLGLWRATASREGQAAIRAEEERIRKELGED